MPHGSSEYFEFDSYNIEHEDLSVSVNDVVLDTSKDSDALNRVLEPKIDLKSVLRTAQPLPRPRTTRQAMLTLEKRNLNTPENNAPVDVQALKEYSLQRFLDCYCHKDAKKMLETYSNERVGAASDPLAAWLLDFKEKKLKMIDDLDLPVEPEDVSSYEMMIKPEPKNTLEPNGPFEYSILQNLLVHKKRVNALFSPIFRVLFDRFSSLLKPSVYCHLRKNVEALNDHLNDNLDVNRKYKLLEIDQEKFDKSQTDVCFEIEMFFLEKLGFDKELLDLWKSGHESSSGTNFANGIKAFLIYQRKTGDAMTCFGNTMISMVALATVFDIADAEASYFVGDDSFVFSQRDMRAEEGARHLSLFFNLKGKVISSDHGFFCSYFFANDGTSFKALVDPLKRVERLSKPIVFNEEFPSLKDRWVSFWDLVKHYEDACFHESLSQMVAKRYNTNVNSVRAIEALYSLGKSYKLFSELYTQI